MKPWRFTYIAPLLVGTVFLPQYGSASDYAQRKAAETRRCEAINPGESQSGLAFNPDGYRSYYVQSECFQKAAIQFRNDSLCNRVRRRWSPLWSSWGVSSGQCQKLVAQGVSADRAEIEAEKRRYSIGRPLLKSLRIQRNGNGRDFDILPEFTPGHGHGYTLTFEIIGARDHPVLLHSNGYYLDPNSRLSIFVRQSEIRARFPEFQLNHPYKVRATVTLSIANGGMSGYWSDEFLESVFPARERSQSLTIESRF
jgi:hypothetical protein